MKNLFIHIALVFDLTLSSSAFIAQQQESIEKYSKVRITIQDKADITAMQRAGFSLEGMKVEENAAEIILSEREIIKLKELGLPYEVLIDDMTKYYQERNRRTDEEMKKLEKEMKEKYSSSGFGFGSMGGFYTYSEIVAELDTMRMLYPNLITEKYSIGTTLEGRTIWAAKISDNPEINEGEPEIFYNSLIHADEVAGMMAVIYYMYYLLEHYGTDPEVTYLVDNREFYFVPIINPDGNCYNEQIAPNGGGMWRKNRTDNGNGCYGIDLNRNFVYKWGYDNNGSSPDPCSNNYRGPSAFSEFETQAIRDFCNSGNFTTANNHHTHGDVMFSPWAYVLEQSPDSTAFNKIVDFATSLNGYLNGHFLPPNHWLNYPANGDACDWMYGEQITKPKIFAVLTEIGTLNDGSWPVPERIFPLAAENCYSNKVLAWGPGINSNPPHISESEVYPSYCKAFQDSIHITATESNPENYTSSVTAFLYTDNDSLIDQFNLTEVTDNNYYGARQVPVEENFYHFVLKSTCTELPSNFFYLKDLKFTTAGPLIVDSIEINPISGYRYTIKPYLKNEGSSLTLTHLTVKLICNDTGVSNVYPNFRSCPDITPGVVKSVSQAFVVTYDSARFKDSLNLKFEIMSDGWIYWADTKQVIVGVEEEVFEIPTEFTLSQNYPNPFNPRTKIKYSVPKSSQVQIKVFDVLGNEIVTLVDEEIPAGNYKVDFNASNLPSGVYFYQLNAGEYLQTKKMILLK